MGGSENDRARRVRNASLYAMRHYVTIMYHAWRDPANAATAFLSAFVMQAHGVWFLVTAGHCLDEIAKLRSQGLTVGLFKLWDNWSVLPASTHRDPVPFAMDDNAQLRIDCEGIDFGLVILSPLIADCLKANHVVPIGPESYGQDWPAEMDGYSLIGTPTAVASFEQRPGRQAIVRYSAVAIEIERIAEPPPELLSDNPRFYARIIAHEDDPQWLAMNRDIDGMSGGPIVGVKLGDQDHYWIIGVQSSWLPSRRIIAATPFQQIARGLYLAMESHLQTTMSDDHPGG